MDIKIQTRRSTQFKKKIINLNCFVNKNFEIGIVTSEYWGNFKERKEPLIEINLNKINFRIPLNEFLGILEKGLKGKHFEA